jgi:hypothetical protein
MGVKYKDGQNYPATYEDYVPPGAVARCMLEMMDYLYPVGCYFETTDTDFDPNQTFGGTWVSENDVYIVESGKDESDNLHLWNWKKYSDGTFDAWCKVTDGYLTHYATSAPIYWYMMTISFPNNMKPIDTNYSVYNNAIIGNGHSWGTTTLAKTTSSFNTYAGASGGGYQSHTWFLYIHGKYSNKSITANRWHRTA